jgi:hypothetical protein
MPVALMVELTTKPSTPSFGDVGILNGKVCANKFETRIANNKPVITLFLTAAQP